jgi:hypothetical protein
VNDWEVEYGDGGRKGRGREKRLFKMSLKRGKRVLFIFSLFIFKSE